MKKTKGITMGPDDSKKIVEYILDNKEEFMKNNPLELQSFVQSHIFVSKCEGNCRLGPKDLQRIATKMWNSINDEDLNHLEGAMIVEYMRETFWLGEIIEDIPKDKLIILFGRDIFKEAKEL